MPMRERLWVAEGLSTDFSRAGRLARWARRGRL